MPQLPAVGSTMARGIFGAGFGFRVGWCVAGGGGFGGFLLVLVRLSFWRGGFGVGLSFHGVWTIS